MKWTEDPDTAGGRVTGDYSKQRLTNQNKRTSRAQTERRPELAGNGIRNSATDRENTQYVYTHSLVEL